MTAARVTLVAFAKHASRQSFVPFGSSVAYGKASTFATCTSRVCAKSGPAPFTGQGFSSVSAALAAARRATVPHGTSFAASAVASAAVPKRVSAGAVVPQYSSAFATAARAGFSAAAGKVTNAAAPHPLVAGGVFAEKAVGWWLIGGCAWVFSMVVLGGVTRLTRSGLAMTDWKFQWETPPLSDGDWDIEFRKYKESPEFKMTNKNMTVDEYKFIYWMEWSHRMWGRGLGVYFALPLVAFVLKGWITGKLGLRLVSFFGLGAAQGAIGTYCISQIPTLFDAPGRVHY
jgi:cytochrome c oxidase assembly protein subunit 15